MNLGDSKTRKL
uniref:Uncharacterized protein n=1 Tax=Rhizophora mucronata TaxID=61149 RepID=A0A2P2P6P6_RHIMU